MKLAINLLGFLLLGVGFAGLILPILPGFPFFVGAAFCFSKTNPRFHQWLITRDWMPKRGKMSLNAKLKAMLSLTLLLAVGYFFARKLWWVFVLVWLFHLVLFCLMPTKKDD